MSKQGWLHTIAHTHLPPFIEGSFYTARIDGVSFAITIDLSFIHNDQTWLGEVCPIDGQAFPLTAWGYCNGYWLGGPVWKQGCIVVCLQCCLANGITGRLKFFGILLRVVWKIWILALFKDNAMSDSLPPILARQVSCLSTIFIPASRLEDTDSRIALDFTAVSVGADSPVTNLSKKGASLRSRTMRPPATTLAKPRDTWLLGIVLDSFCDAVQEPVCEWMHLHIVMRFGWFEMGVCEINRR